MVKRIAATTNELEPGHYAQQIPDNDSGIRTCSRHVCGLGRAYIYVVGIDETACLGDRTRRLSLS
jgi:hypothetical protein